MCLACQHFDLSSADWISDNLHVLTADICEQWERNLSFGSADVRGAGTRDEPLRTSAWEATKVATKPEFLVAMEKILVSLATVSVAISSPAICHNQKWAVIKMRGQGISPG